MDTTRSLPDEEARALKKTPFGWLPRVSVEKEVQELFRLVRLGTETPESVRELIEVPSEIEEVLRFYAQENPEDADGIEGMIQFRRQVLREFKRLIRQSRKSAAGYGRMV